MGTCYAAWLAALVGLTSPVCAATVIVPRTSTLQAGASCSFRLQPDRPGSLPSAAWTWALLAGGTGDLDPATGHYTAPPVDRPCLMRIRATCQDGTGDCAEASVLVLPHQPFDVVAKVLGADWLVPFGTDLPFLDEATQQRFGHRVRGSNPRPSPWAWMPVQVAGYGLPFTLQWQLQARGRAQLLSYREGDHMVRRDVTGQRTQVITATARLNHFLVEALQPLDPAGVSWHSDTLRGQLHLRGLLPFTGNPVAAPGHQDGRGLAARFRQPFGVARVAPTSGPPGGPSWFLVSDQLSHVIRLVKADGSVSTPWGQPDQPGHLDSRPGLLDRLARSCWPEPGNEPGPSRFNGPTFLCAGESRVWCAPWRHCTVADSGNHVVRVLRPDGSASTLAGVPGQPGHRDAWLCGSALFNNPQGLAEDWVGNLYVADQGNAVIRRITPGGQVTTVAGSPGLFGSADGTGPEARFTDLRGLALAERAGSPVSLFIVDGHAVRRLHVPTGRVTTVLGQVATPGFQDAQDGEEAARRAVLAGPCLRSPCGLLATGDGLLIADQGNHSLRAWRQRQATLVTLAGDPGLVETRWGLLRDGLPAPLDERYAALDGPRTLASSFQLPESHFVTTGACLGELSAARVYRQGVGPVHLDCPPAACGEPYVLRFTAPVQAVDLDQRVVTIHYSVDFLEADGTLADRCRGTCAPGVATPVVGQFCQRGRAAVVVRCVSDQGISAGARGEVAVR